MSFSVHSTAPSRPPSARSRRLAVWLATGLGVGYGPVMPGTYGSALGVGLYLVLAAGIRPLPSPQVLLGVVAVLVAAVSIPVVSIALRSFRVQDPQEIVLDEVAGQLLTLVALPLHSGNSLSYWAAVAAGFVLFRAMDTAKPYPVWKLEKLPGAWGVMCDDLGAGVLAALSLVLLQWLGWTM